MRHILFLITVILSFSCTENDKKLDRETNTYYAKYKFIFEKHDSLGLEKSKELLDEYIQEFPNAADAYKFKAYLMAKAADFKGAEQILLRYEGDEKVKNNLKNYLISLLLMDENNLPKAKKYLNEIPAYETENLEHLFNTSWVALYEKNYGKADELSQQVLAKDTNDISRYKLMPHTIRAAMQDTAYIDSLKNNTDISHTDFLEDLAHQKIALDHLYKSLSY